MKSAFVLLLLVLSARSSLAIETVKVGIALRVTPEINSFAPALNRGIEYAETVFETKNHQIAVELVKYPHKSGHESVEQAARKIIADKVKYVLGGEMSDEAFALAETFHNQKTLLMTPTSSNPFLTAGNPLVFRACFSDDQVASLMAKYVASLKHVKTIAVLHNTSNAYSDYLTNAFLDEFEKLNKGKDAVKISEFRYASEQPDFMSTVFRFKRENADLVLAFTLQETLKAFVTLAQKASFHPLYLGSDGWGTNESLIKSLPDFKGIRNAYWVEDSKATSVRAFKTGFEKKYGTPPDAWNAIAYDAATALFEAIAKAKNPHDPTEVAELLHSMTFKDGASSTSLKFNHHNTAVKPFYLYEVSKAGSKLVKEME
ncbi:MAG: ABC transporter substrate-binding protein [Bdellovibrionales bacterium]|nr:ABC transporter substrate-binding protein [Oligoflexia bacterium]